MHGATGRLGGVTGRWGCRRRPAPRQAVQEQSAAGEALAQARGEQERLRGELLRLSRAREGLVKEGASLAVQLAAAQRHGQDRAQEADGLRWVLAGGVRVSSHSRIPGFGSTAGGVSAGRRRRGWRAASSSCSSGWPSSTPATSSWRPRAGPCSRPRRRWRVSGPGPQAVPITPAIPTHSYPHPSILVPPHLHPRLRFRPHPHPCLHIPISISTSPSPSLSSSLSPHPYPCLHPHSHLDPRPHPSVTGS